MVAMGRAYTGQCETRLHHPFGSLAPAHQLPICAVQLSRQGADRNRLMSRIAAQTLGGPAAAATWRWSDGTLSWRPHRGVAHDANRVCQTARGEALAEFGVRAVTGIGHYRRLRQIVC